MEITIKNKTFGKQKAVLFGYNEFTFNDYKKKDEVSFFDINTDEGIEITMNGDSTQHGKLSIIKNLVDNPKKLKSIEYTTNSIKPPNMFYVYMSDANGNKYLYKPIHPSIFVSPTQETIYPIIIDSKPEHNTRLKGIDGNTALLFILDSFEEIHLKLNEE